MTNSCIVRDRILMCGNPWDCDYIDAGEDGKCRWCLLGCVCTNEKAKQARLDILSEGE